MLDNQYSKMILEKFDSLNATFTLDDLKKSGFDFGSDQDKFIKHMDDLCDQDAIERRDREPGWGYDVSAGGLLSTSVPLRLTRKGRELLARLQHGLQ